MKTVSFLILSIIALGVCEKDQRFGVVGASGYTLANSEADIPWWRLYNTDWNPPYVHNRLFTVGKLDGRAQGEGLQVCTPSKFNHETMVADHDYDCDYSTKAAQENYYNQIFEFEKPKMQQIVNGFGPNSTIHFSIGNEPNLWPYVDPDVYAAIFKKYYDYLKSLQVNGKTIVVHNGGIITVDARDMLESVDYLLNILESAGELVSVVSGDLSFFVHLFQAVTTPASAQIRYWGWKTWTYRFLDRLAILNGRVDVFDVHIYKIPDFWGITEYEPEDALKEFQLIVKGGTQQAKFSFGTWNVASGKYICTTQGLKTFLGQQVYDRNGNPVNISCPTAIPTLNIGNNVKEQIPFRWNNPNPEIWIDEFGSMILNGTEQSSIDIMNSMVSNFKRYSAVKKWFWYKNYGKDAKFDPIPLVDAPTVQLYSDPALTNLTRLGRNYLNLPDRANIVPILSLLLQ